MITGARYDKRGFSETPGLQTLKKKIAPALLPATKYVFESELLNSLIGRWLLQRLLEKKEVSLEKLHLTPDDHGKPRLSLPLDFSIAHSFDVVICLVSDEGPVGVDVEKIRDVPLEEYQSSFTEHEWSFIMKDHNKIESFFSLWTKKESLLKMHGLGLQVPLTQVTVLDTVGVITANASIHTGVWHRHAIPGYSCHVAVPENASSFEIDVVVF
ncbi:4'-phosphopantetheinyl transferase family protein [Chryseolinea soli]|uniref:4'-phosphopantetheinyl transferase superfamily protein n=1 Tax=Chryseolinea soli TaxID=2321403 RepID=A0A385SI42_9BACT|nr:4'-phosphopantetheinyl transferase superfamily protein [Chryseolinea soli]AYB29585.1 4'-phosphopantetheinyl transferase superfamily protein [Chryseolinea soli]